MYWHPDKVYPRLYEGKLSAFDFEGSQDAFEGLHNFISESCPSNMVYVELFVKIKLYENTVKEFLKTFRTLNFVQA
jgi:ssDNA-specific exonuclease RecJ